MSKPSTIPLTIESLKNIRATEKSVRLLRQCKKNRENMSGPFLDHGELEKILEDKYRCFQVIIDNGSLWNSSIYYQGPELDLALKEFVTRETAVLKGSTDAINWFSIGSWVRNNGTWGNAHEHAYGSTGRYLAE